MRDDLVGIKARVNDALTSYESVRAAPLLEASGKPGEAMSLKATLAISKQELFDTFNFRLAQQRAQTSTLQCKILEDYTPTTLSHCGVGLVFPCILIASVVRLVGSRTRP